MNVDRLLIVLAHLWGFAEATLFFVVPDVLLSAIVLRSRSLALQATGWATLGALIGGTCLFVWGDRDPGEARRVLARVPAVSERMISQVRTEIAQQGGQALLQGPINGVPYKVYAVEAGAARLSPGLFLLISVPARLMRFVAVVLLADVVKRALERKAVGTAAQAVILGVAWLVFYAAYWATLGW
jgi:membrane protein YqaA with SNARE-associated domain